MKSNYKPILGLIIGVLSGVLISNLYLNIFGNSSKEWGDYLSSGDVSAWVLILTMYGAPIISGIALSLLDHEIWKIVIFPFIIGVLAAIVAFLACAVIYLCVSGNIFYIIAAVLLFMAICAPVARVIIVFFN